MMNIDNIINKYNYSIELAQFLKDVYRALIDYFGESNEEIIYNALLSCPIISSKNCYDELLKLGLIDIDNNMVTMNDLKISSGVYESKPKIIHQNGKFTISSIERAIVIKDLDVNNKVSKATLIHEIGHLVKSYYNEYEIDGNILTFKSGLIEKKYQLEIINEKVQKRLILELGVGLEEGFNSLLEEDIARKIIDPNYQSTGYGLVNGIASNFKKYLSFFLNAQIYKNKSELISRFGIYYSDLEILTDKFYQLNLQLLANAFNEFRKQEIIAEIQKLQFEEYIPIMKKIMKQGLRR